MPSTYTDIPIDSVVNLSHYLDRMALLHTSAVRARIRNLQMDGRTSANIYSYLQRYRVTIPPGTVLHSFTTQLSPSMCELVSANILRPQPTSTAVDLLARQACTYCQHDPTLIRYMAEYLRWLSDVPGVPYGGRMYISGADQALLHQVAQRELLLGLIGLVEAEQKSAYLRRRCGWYVCCVMMSIIVLVTVVLIAV